MNSVSAMQTRSGWRGAIAHQGGLLSFALVCAVFVCGVAIAADLPLARFDSLVPAAAQIGAEIEVQVAGADLEGVDTAWFSHPGLSARLVKEKVFGIKTDPSVPEGVYDMRLFGTNGVSNPRAIYVGRGATVPKAGECSLQKPMEFPPNAAPPLGGGITTGFRPGRDSVLRSAARPESWTLG
jgi:hypothetical protein